MNKNIAIIPARGGSKRLPGKNILPLGGIPLLAHSILFAKANSTIIDEVYVTTDCPEVKEVALQFGAKVIDRPESLSGDLEPTVTAVKHAVEVIGKEFENVILLQPTNPLRPKNLLSEAWGIYTNENYDSLFTVTRNYQKFGTIENKKFLPFNYEIGQRSQDLEPLYFENGLLYISKSSLILQNQILGETAFPFIIDHPFANIDIDNKEDLNYANYLINKFNNEL